MKKISFTLFVFALIGCSTAKQNNEHLKADLSVIKMKKDIKYVKRKLIKMHPDADLYISYSSLEKKFDSVANTINTPLKPNAFYLKLSPILASVRQGHIAINMLYEQVENSKQKNYKESKSPLIQLDYLWKNNRLYVVKNRSKNENIQVGAEILTINGVSPQQIHQKYTGTFSSDGLNETFLDKWFERKISGYYASEFGVIDSINIQITCSDSISNQIIHRLFKEDKKREDLVLTKIDSTSLRVKDRQKSDKDIVAKEDRKATRDSLKAVNKKREIFGYNLSNREAVIELNYPKQDSTLAVLKIRSFSGTNYKKAYKTIFQEIREKKIQHLVLDLRGNTGGRLNEISDLYSYLTREKEYVFLNPTVVKSKWSLPFYMNAGRSTLHYIIFSPVYIIQYPFIVFNTKKNKLGEYNYKLKQEKISKRKELNYEGELFVLTDGLSFSSAAIISSALKGSKRAIFVGDETGGSYNGTVAGRLPVLTLPKSKLKWRLGLMHIKPKQQTEVFGHGVFPDVRIIPTVDQIINKEDPEMEWIYENL